MTSKWDYVEDLSPLEQLNKKKGLLEYEIRSIERNIITTEENLFKLKDELRSKKDTLYDLNEEISNLSWDPAKRIRTTWHTDH